MIAPVYDEAGRFHGHQPRECGEHRTVGSHRAWCFACSEWCYPSSPCVRCEIASLRGTQPRVPQCGDPDYERCPECQAHQSEPHLPGCDAL